MWAERRGALRAALPLPRARGLCRTPRVRAAPHAPQLQRPLPPGTASSGERRWRVVGAAEAPAWARSLHRSLSAVRRPARTCAFSPQRSTAGAQQQPPAPRPLAQLPAPRHCQPPDPVAYHDLYRCPLFLTRTTILYISLQPPGPTRSFGRRALSTGCGRHAAAATSAATAPTSARCGGPRQRRRDSSAQRAQTAA